MMIARPLVAGTIAGAILGDIPTGLKLGVVFELLQYDILPVGAVRYPEYGPATVAAVATAHAAPRGRRPGPRPRGPRGPRDRPPRGLDHQRGGAVVAAALDARTGPGGARGT